MKTAPAPARRFGAFLTAAAVIAAGLLIPTAASAADGAAPAPTDYRVVAKTHTDAVSTFLDDGQFTLGSKADVPEGNGTRFNPSHIWFHIDGAAATVVPAGYEFIADVDSPIWLAPETNPGSDQLWPGFSTESLAVGAADGDSTTFTLTGLEGPGALELFTSGVFGAPNRLWSSDETGFTSFKVGRTHMHANWAFTAAGTYHLDVRASIAIGGEIQTADATYTFVVGDLPEKVQTSTSVTPSAAQIVLGEEVTLAASVTPTDSHGYVEFRHGDTILGHEAVDTGAASITVAELGVGTHDITAAYVPAIANLADGSTSATSQVIVTEEAGGQEFGIIGLKESYVAGDALEARAVGATLADGESFRWVLRDIGGTSSYVTRGSGAEHAAGVLEMPVDMGTDGYELSVQLRSGSTTVQQSAWKPIQVEPTAASVSASLDQTGVLYLGDEVSVSVASRQLGAGESLRLVQRWSSPWYEVPGATVNGSTIDVAPSYAFNEGFWAVQVVRDGVAVAQSAQFPVEISNREVMIEGVQGVYREGSTLKATGTVFPAREGLRYTWSFGNYTVDPWITKQLKSGTDASALSLEVPATLDLDGGSLYLVASLDDDSGTQVGQTSVPLNVSSAAPDEQLFFFQALGGHYHQGYEINLGLVADPALADGDTVDWAWRFPGQSEFSPLPGASGLNHLLVAEQGLDDVEVRGTLVYADGSTLDSEPVVIQVDDHGAAPRQKMTVTGIADRYHPGDTLELTASVDPASVIDRYEWLVQKSGEDTPMIMEGENDAQLSFEATSELAGAAVFARLVLPNGDVYVESAPVIVHLDDHGTEVPETELTVSTNRAADDYWVGQTATLTAAQSTPTGLTEHRWLVKKPGESDFTAVSDQSATTYSFKPTIMLSGVQVKVQLLHGGETHAESDPVTITTQQRPVATVLEVTQDQPVHAQGDVVQFTSAQRPETGIDHYHWYIKRAGAADYVWVDQSREKDLSLPVTAADDQAQVVIRLFDETHAVIAESEPVVLNVTTLASEKPATTAPEPTGSLAVTGGAVDLPPFGTGAVVLLLAGATLFVINRRRRATGAGTD